RPERERLDNIHFARTLDEAARLAVRLSKEVSSTPSERVQPTGRFAPGQRYLRGLFSGGTLAYEALLILQDYLTGVYSNIPLDKRYKLPNSLQSQEHTLLDLGEDEFTVGRLHPMMDNDLRIRRLLQEAADPETAVIFLDVVLGYGAHPDPASELAPAIRRAREQAEAEGRHLEVVAVVVGTDDDPQGFSSQVEALKNARVQIFSSNEAAAHHVGELLLSLNTDRLPPVSSDAIRQPLAAINVGVESFAESLRAQGATVVQMDWRPPAGGNEKLAALLARMKSR
ncbi:MAG: acyl-CoA synthetase FdrA, partial [Chloroflexi bacterium]